MWVFLVTEIMFFGGLFLAYFAYRQAYPSAFASASNKTNLWIGAANTTVLICSSLTMALAVASINRGDIHRNRVWLATTAMLGAPFIGGQVYEFTTFYREGLGYTTNLFGSAFYTLTGFHGVHVSVGIVMLLSLLVMSLRGNLGPERAESVEIVGLYWHFVDIVWIVIFTVVYLIP